jgi:hypothetical protein
MHPSARTLALCATYALLALAVFIRNGHYHPVALLLLCAGLGIALWAALWPDRVEALIDRRVRARGHLLPGLLVLFLALDLFPPGVYLRGFAWNAGTWGLTLLAVPFALATFPEGSAPRRGAKRLLGPLAEDPLVALAAIGIAAKMYLLIASPRPIIDVWTILQEGADAFGRGENPYEVLFTNPYQRGAVTDSYVYPPLMLLVSAPFRWFFGDVRVGFLLCEVASFALLWRLGRAPIFALLFLFHPRALFVLEQSWTEPVVTTCFLALLCALRERRPVLATVCAGLLFASKQYLLLLAPLLYVGARALRMKAREAAGRAAAAVVVGLAVILPFALWNPEAFVHDVLEYHLRSPFHSDALNLTAFFHDVADFLLPAAVSVAMAIGALGLALFAYRRDATAAGFASACALTLGLALLFQKHAFCNYYYLVGTMLLSAAALRDREAGEVAEPSTEAAVA